MATEYIYAFPGLTDKIVFYLLKRCQYISLFYLVTLEFKIWLEFVAQEYSVNSTHAQITSATVGF